MRALFNLKDVKGHLSVLHVYSYHEKVAYDPPDLEINDKTFGLVSPEPFELPNIAPLWTAAAYAAMDISKNLEDRAKEKPSVVVNNQPQACQSCQLFLCSGHS